MVEFEAGFAVLADELGKEIVGDAIQPEFHPNGDRDMAFQITSKGLMVWGNGATSRFLSSGQGVDEPAGPEPWSPKIIKASSPNHGGFRSVTTGCVIHSTRGGSGNYATEFNGTLNWFASTASQVSAHIVIAADGTIAEVVNPDLIAWHAGQHNSTMLGVELTQPRQGDMITVPMYKSLAWWLRKMSAKYGFALDRAHLPEHKDTPQGKSMGKSDVSFPYSFEELSKYL